MTDFDNTIAKSFNAHFCAVLEFHLTRAFQNNHSNRFERIWCDGVAEPEAWRQDLRNFYETKEIITYTWLDLNGQGKFSMIIRLGDLSFDRCLNGLNLEECLLGDETLDWVELDTTNHIITLQLK